METTIEEKLKKYKFKHHDVIGIQNLFYPEEIPYLVLYNNEEGSTKAIYCNELHHCKTFSYLDGIKIMEKYLNHKRGFNKLPINYNNYPVNEQIKIYKSLINKQKDYK